MPTIINLPFKSLGLVFFPFGGFFLQPINIKIWQIITHLHLYF